MRVQWTNERRFSTSLSRVAVYFPIFNTTSNQTQINEQISADDIRTNRFQGSKKIPHTVQMPPYFLGKMPGFSNHSTIK